MWRLSGRFIFGILPELHCWVNSDRHLLQNPFSYVYRDDDKRRGQMAQGHAHLNVVTCPWLRGQGYELNLGSWGLGSMRLWVCLRNVP